MLWMKIEEGYTESRCGRFVIKHRFIGRTGLQYYVLLMDGEKVGTKPTRNECKERAAYLLAKEAEN